MTVAVIGAKGFLGSHLVTALRNAHVATAEFTVETPFLLPNGSAAAALASADTAFYLASTINPAIAARDPEAVDQDLRRFEAFLAAIKDSPTRVILPSSGGTVYDTTTSPPYDEHSPPRPMNRFGEAKLAMERLLLERASQTIRPVILRISNVYGPGQPAGTGQGVIAHWFAAAAAREPLHLYGDPSTTRDFIYIDDVVEAMLVPARSDEPLPEVINIGSGEPTTLRELADLISDVVGSVEVFEDPDRGFDVPRTWLDIGLAVESLGWRPRVALRDGLERTWRHVTMNASTDDARRASS